MRLFLKVIVLFFSSVVPAVTDINETAFKSMTVVHWIYGI